MYIALKWLIALAMTLWMGLCCFDIYVKEPRKRTSDFMAKQYEALIVYDNVSASINKKIYNQENDNWKYKYVKQHYKQQSMAFLHYITFLAGAIAVSVFNKKNVIIKFAKKGLLHMNMPTCCVSRDNVFNNNLGALDFKQLAASFSVAALNYMKMMWGTVKELITKAVLYVVVFKNGDVTNTSTPTNEKEIGQQRETLGQLLLAAIDENKNIRLKYQTEKTAKDKLLRYIDETKNSIKEKRTQYVSFQQLYLVTHRENIFLKYRLKKIVDEKDTAEKNLISLINQVYRSKDTALKAYCTRFIVHSKKNLLNSDVRAEIRKFLEKSQKSPSDTFTENCGNKLGIKLSATSSLPECSCHITEVLQDDNNLVSVMCNAPNLIGLPGEYIFTVKDKHGITKKMYEYKIDYNNDEEISNLRQYSVYEDKSCLLNDCKADERSELPEKTVSTDLGTREATVQLDLTPIKNQRFLTGSEEFKIFLRNSPVSFSPKIQVPALPCG